MKLESAPLLYMGWGSWHQDASPKGSSRFSSKPPVHNVCLRQALQPFVTKNTPRTLAQLS